MAAAVVVVARISTSIPCAVAFTVPASSLMTHVTPLSSSSTTRIFAAGNEDDDDTSPTGQRQQQPLFDPPTLAEANDALASVGWSGVAPGIPNGEEGELTSEDPFVRSIDEGIRGEMGVGLDELLNPAKVVNLERDLYNLRTELASLTGASPPADGQPLTTELCDGGNGGPDADALRTKIAKKERDLSTERRSVFRGWLKDVFLGQAVLSAALSYVMATNPD